MHSLSGSDPAGYQRHLLHGDDRTYVESNCYSDVIIELLHACGYEPLAAFGHLVRMDFEGDQWTFFKPPPEDLESLFGVDIHEMQPYRPLPEQIAEQLRIGRTIIVELDSWYLPDTASTSYRSEHVKSSIAADAIDPDGQTLRYFHGPGLFELGGDDYRGVFRIGEFSDDVLPPYTELVRFDAGQRLEGEDAAPRRRELLRRHLRERPRENPFDRFGQQLEQELPALLDGGLERYHAYAFATVRMAGSAFEILADHARWLIGRPGAAGRRRHARDRRWMQGAVVPARQAPPVRLRAADRRAGRRVDARHRRPARGLCLTLEATELSEGWEVACAAPGTTQDIAELDGLEWLPTRVPGTAAGALRAAGRWDWHDGRDFDADDWWFRTRFDAEPAGAGEELMLALDGIATVADVYLNGERVLSSDSMFAGHRLDVGRLIGPRNELAIHCRALAPLLEVSRRPRARWRTALVSNGNLRFYRTMLLGRAPGFAPGPAAVGPWKPVRLERRRGVAVRAAGAASAAGRCARPAGGERAAAGARRRRRDPSGGDRAVGRGAGTSRPGSS